MLNAASELLITLNHHIIRIAIPGYELFLYFISHSDRKIRTINLKYAKNFIDGITNEYYSFIIELLFECEMGCSASLDIWMTRVFLYCISTYLFFRFFSIFKFSFLIHIFYDIRLYWDQDHKIQAGIQWTQKDIP